MKQRVLILGGTGMLGHTLFKQLRKDSDLTVFATVRSLNGLSRWFSPEEIQNMVPDVDAGDFDSIIRTLASVQPDVVINCIGLIKQLSIANEPLYAIPINSLLPHRIALLCQASKARMIHISTDCVFNGQKGNYSEDDPSDATDLYGRSKFLGEVAYPNSITIRTSIIGHELKSMASLVDWFLAQEGQVRGFTKALFSGFPTVEIARIIQEYILPRPNLSGLYQVSAMPISKYELLCFIAEKYQKRIIVEPYEDFVLNRVLNSSRFQAETGYTPPEWEKLITAMHLHYQQSPHYKMEKKR